MIGKTISHYRVLERLGSGGMGSVYKAQDSRLGRFVALKFLNEEFAQDRQALERFHREARAASSLNHNHICTIYDIGEYEDQSSIVMELLEGVTLKERIATTSLRLDKVIEWGLQIADALEAAHSKGIVHRDLKPANIFITQREQAKVLDFGLAKLSPLLHRQNANDSTTMGDDLSLTSTGVAIGTVGYMSPEQVRGEEIDGRSDLFSFGVLLYEMASGRQPFTGAGIGVVFDSILHQTPVPLARANPEMPGELDHIVQKALEKQRDLRYQHASDLRSDLKRLSFGRFMKVPEVAAAPPAVELAPEPDDASAHAPTDEFLANAIRKGASDIHIEPQAAQVAVRLRVDGILRVESALSKEAHTAIVRRVKALAKLNVSESRVPQDGVLSVEIDGRRIDFRVSTAPTKFGEKLVMRVLDKSGKLLPLDRLIVHGPTLESVRALIAQPFGLICFTGPTGSGKTTTIYSALSGIDNTGISIATVEDPIEFDLPGITQMQAQPDIGVGLPRLLRTILFQDPDVIMVGELRDEETGKLAVEAALTGHLVLTQMYANDAPGTLTRLVAMGIDPFMLANATVGVVYQRLARRVCQNCKKQVRVDDTTLGFFGYTKENAPLFYQGGGCEKCNRTGYKGRVGAYEVLGINEELKRGIAAGAPENEIRDLALKSGMRTIKDYAMILLAEGLTSVDEVLANMVVSR